MGEPEDPAVQGANKAFESADEAPTGGPATGTTDEGAPPDDAGQSKRRSAEDIADAEDEKGRSTEGTKGKAERPYGTAEPESATGVDPQETVTGGPEMPPGDQGG
jgi:hypothetical protein